MAPASSENTLSEDDAKPEDAKPEENTKSGELLGALSRKISSLGDYGVRFHVTIDGRSISGTYEVSGDSYHISTNEIEVFCDGKMRWEVNMPDREVILDEVDPDDHTILGNPPRMLDFPDGAYTHSWVGKVVIDGREADKIELTESATGDRMAVWLDVVTGLPVRIEYRIEYLRTDAVVEIGDVFSVKLPPSAFTFDAARYPGFETIDFR